MTGTTRSSADLDPRRRRLLVRAWRRGIREMDLMLGGFADAEIDALSEADLAAFEALLIEDDADILNWITGEKACPADFDTALFRRIAAYRPSFDGKGNHIAARAKDQ
ncbi:succinate dehydrogenase assembly factor 2 [Pseudohoeflea coraliihabitans]|uniref:Succinate dehydrogenase assembly factor 2 n=1 Tax=Pseudohoeflea coraliihabitans TaxID=2860393 RepID=A0ABS6WR24_9HYPH|nr:succinate dehydrogenase assembly factor 2 [Pseudohoeflea sp. DP4N28-3]MBW3098416.1 succinate dehydrogenase assembly factor 2 [Pseudohoeflea sp. DP4N28-3]